MMFLFMLAPQALAWLPYSSAESLARKFYFHGVLGYFDVLCCAPACSKTVTATASTKDKLDFLLAMPNGATHVANYKTQDFSAEVKKTTDGRGVNVLIDFVGQSHWNKNIDSLALEGRMTMLALLSGECS